MYILNRFFFKPYKIFVGVPVIEYLCKNHLNDFLGGSIFCIYVNFVLVFLAKIKPLSNYFLLMTFMFFVSLVWEYFFPIFLSYSTSDPFDVLAYLLGTAFYYVLIYKIRPKHKSWR